MPREQPTPPPLPRETTEYITAERPEVAIQAILAWIRDMQQLNMQMADRLAMGGQGGQGPAVERDNLGRTRSEARKDYLGFTRDRPTFERGGPAGMISPSGSEGL